VPSAGNIARHIASNIASLAELEKVAREKRAGAWAKSRPELQHPTVEETEEPSP
jgi:endonuclease YncB( thermonuclease family)